MFLLFILLIQSKAKPLFYRSKSLRQLWAVGCLSGWVKSCPPEAASVSPHVDVCAGADGSLPSGGPSSETSVKSLSLKMWYGILSLTPDTGVRIPPAAPTH